MPTLPNILIVDDNSTNLLYLEIVLRNIQAHLIKATSGTEALNLTQDTELSLALLDVQMPIMNGYELAGYLNERWADHKVPIIFLTANYPENSKVLEGYNAGAVDYIIKPLNETILISKVKVFLELYWQKQRLIENSKKLRTSEQELMNTKLQLEQMNQHLIRAIEEDRSTISLRVHDELGQSMTALNMDMNWVQQNLHNPEQASKKLDKMILMAKDVIHTIQRLSSELHPGMLDDLGLVATTEWYCKEFKERSGISYHLDLEDIEPVSTEVNLMLYRIIQETLTNVIRHAKATEVIIHFGVKDDEITLIISDNGIGIPTNKLKSGNSFGIIGMRQRVSQCQGTIEISGSQGKGTKTVVKVPKKILL
jgi:signal transduction histidine kinase